MTESISFFDANNVEYLLHQDSTRMVTSLKGVGAPDIQHFTQKTPFQDGEQHLGYKFGPRKIIVGIYRNPATRALLQTDHQTLLTALRPDLGAGVLKWTLNDGTIRQLDVWFSGGMKLDSDTQGIGLFQNDVIELTAFSPFWYNPTANSTTSSMEVATSLFFPFVFPFVLPSSGISANVTVTNNGQVDALPTITINGPGVDPSIFNSTTGKRITITYTLAAGEYITVDSSTGAKTCVLTVGPANSNIIGYMSSDSEFFPIIPGANELVCGLSSTTAASSIVISFNDPFLGV